MLKKFAYVHIPVCPIMGKNQEIKGKTVHTIQKGYLKKI